jgi:hypothetical protein
MCIVMYKCVYLREKSRTTSGVHHLSHQSWTAASTFNRCREDKCWFCHDQHRMARSHVLLHCNDRIRVAREKHGKAKTLAASGSYWPTLGGRKDSSSS